MKRSARSAVKLSWNIEVQTVVAGSAGFTGASFICNVASRDTSIVTPPSSAYRTYSGARPMTLSPTALDATNVMPFALPPFAPTPGKSDCPNAFLRAPTAYAFVSDRITVSPDNGTLFVEKYEISRPRSDDGLSVDAAVGAPFVIDAGDTLAT